VEGVYATTTELIKRLGFTVICTATSYIRSLTQEIIQKELTDPQEEDIHTLNSQYLGKFMESVTVLVRLFI